MALRIDGLNCEGRIMQRISMGGVCWRRPTRLAVAAATVAAALLSASEISAQDRQARDISGIWWSIAYSPKLEIQGGGDIPYNDKGKAQYAKNAAGLKDGSIKDEARYHCLPDGVPRILGNPYPFKIVQTPGQTTFLYELNAVLRVVLMDTPQLPPDEIGILPYYSGHSIGHWDADTLVVEAGGFNVKTFLDATGAPHSDQMSTVERIRKINGGKQLEDVVTVTDPVMLTKPFSARFVYAPHPETSLEDYVCGEPHRDISRIPGVSEARRARGP